jgi:mannose-6-phosphate isomerase
MALYPLNFDPIYKPKVWGGRTLEKLGRDLPAGEDIGESWELADLTTTSASGGGGGAEHSRVANGPLAGRSVQSLIDEFGEQLMGRLQPTDDGCFPLLVKFLDARQNLSVQVHPNADYAAKHDDAYLKSEAWYIVDAEPGAVIYKGVKEGVRPEQFREAIANNTVEELIIAVPVSPGDCHYLPSGTCHALGEGILVAEVQTPSDTTFRVYDWGRTGRELHVDEAIECIEFGAADTIDYELDGAIDTPQGRAEPLVRCEYFRIDKFTIRAGVADAVNLDGTQPKVWMLLAGAGRLTCDHEQAGEVAFGKGQTLLIPAGTVNPRFEVADQTVLLEVTFPQAMGDVIA